jgi:hypothetical protein
VSPPDADPERQDPRRADEQPQPAGGEPHPEQVPDDDAADRPAPYLVPVPAADIDRPLTRRRALAHDPWAPATRYDLVVAGEPHGGPTHLDQTVPVLDVRDYYRRTELSHPVEPSEMPLAHIWVERLYTRHDLIPATLLPPEPARPTDGGGQAHDPDVWVRDTARPPVRQLVRGDLCGERTPVGSRAVYSTRAGLHQAIRVVSEPYLHDFGWLPPTLDDLDRVMWVQAVTCCTELDWALWAATGHTPPSTGPLPLSRLFLD